MNPSVLYRNMLSDDEPAATYQVLDFFTGGEITVPFRILIQFVLRGSYESYSKHMNCTASER